MFAVFGKSLKREYEKSFNRFGVKIKDEYKHSRKTKVAIKSHPIFQQKAQQCNL